MRIGFVGLGNMGGPMARNLVRANFEVVVFDLDSALAQTFQEVGATIAASAEALAANVDVLMTSLPGPRQSRATMPALLSALKPGSLWIDLTTNDRALLMT